MFDAIKARLVGCGFKQLGGAAEFPDVESQVKALPAAFILPLAEKAERNPLGDGYAQQVAVAFSVVIAISRTGGAGKRLDVLGPYKTAVIEKLAGWSPGEGYDPVEYNGGQMMTIGEKALWWQMTFTTGIYIQG